jgi:hypothetical protein
MLGPTIKVKGRYLLVDQSIKFRSELENSQSSGWHTCFVLEGPGSNHWKISFITNIHLAQDMIQRCAVVNAVMVLRFLSAHFLIWPISFVVWAGRRVATVCTKSEPSGSGIDNFKIQ